MQFIFFRNSELAPLVEKMAELVQNEETQAQAADVLSELYWQAAESGYRGNLWNCVLTEALLTDENPYTRLMEQCEEHFHRVGNEVEYTGEEYFTKLEERYCEIGGSLRKAVQQDLCIFIELFHTDPVDVFGEAGALIRDFVPPRRPSYGSRYSKEISEIICNMARTFGQVQDVRVMLFYLEETYARYGVGMYGLHKAFRIEALSAEDSSRLRIRAINNIAETSLYDLVGYETQKKQLVENTEAFIEGRKANNCLLYGPAGTGKSSSIRALLKEYYDRGLRIIEVYKHQYREINTLIDRLKNRNYRFIIYLDDLSFEEFEVEYKYLKAVIEGGLESRPDNVLIYATSNRRHLVKESFSDRPESPLDKHENETVQEKLSLFARFGVSIYYPAPEQQEFFRIVEQLAWQARIDMSAEELHLAANRWELHHSGRSGRAARQLVDYLAGQQKKR